MKLAVGYRSLSIVLSEGKYYFYPQFILMITILNRLIGNCSLFIEQFTFVIDCTNDTTQTAHSVGIGETPYKKERND